MVNNVNSPNAENNIQNETIVEQTKEKRKSDDDESITVKSKKTKSQTSNKFSLEEKREIGTNFNEFGKKWTKILQHSPTCISKGRTVENIRNFYCRLVAKKTWNDFISGYISS